MNVDLGGSSSNNERNILSYQERSTWGGGLGLNHGLDLGGFGIINGIPRMKATVRVVARLPKDIINIFIPRVVTLFSVP